MFISKELAAAMAEGRKRFLSVYEGRAVLFMPYGGDRHRYVATHYVPELHRSVLCPGPEECRFHHVQEVAKCHVAALVLRKALPYSSREGKGLPKKGSYSPEAWTAKIVELTESCFKAFQDQRPEGTLATIARPAGRKNGQVEFRWMESELTDYPEAPLSVEELLPVVIRGTFYNQAEVHLDKSGQRPIKHKI